MMLLISLAGLSGQRAKTDGFKFDFWRDLRSRLFYVTLTYSQTLVV